MSELPTFVDEPAWVRPVFEFSDQALQAHPPVFPPSVKRQEALMVLDGPLHLEAANRFRSTYEFLVRRVRRVVEEISACKDSSGTHVWRIYNHGFVVRSGGRTVAFDIVRGWKLRDGTHNDFLLPEELCRRLVAELDVMFISHNHADHVDLGFCEMLFEAGVPVVADSEILGGVKDQPLLIRHDDKEGVHAIHELECPGFGSPLRYIPYPGHQGGLDCTVNLVWFPDGTTVMHSGDLSGNKDWEWIECVHEHHQVDVLLINCWTEDMKRTIKGVQARMVVTGHETEMAHGPANREAYWRSFQIFRGMPEPPSYVLCWGEGVVIGH